MTKNKLTLEIQENNSFKIKGNLLLATFLERGNYIIFSPQFDVCGYGETLEAAKFSFGYCFGQFLGYQKGSESLKIELLRLGWCFAKKTATLTAPVGCSLGGINYKDLVLHEQKINSCVKF